MAYSNIPYLNHISPLLNEAAVDKAYKKLSKILLEHTYRKILKVQKKEQYSSQLFLMNYSFNILGIRYSLTQTQTWPQSLKTKECTQGRRVQLKGWNALEYWIKRNQYQRT